MTYININKHINKYNYDIGHASKTTKITLFDPVICKTSDAPLQDELLC